jgi:hypothetical protein
VVLTFFTVRPRFNDPDTWWHLRVGQVVVEQRTIPRVDTFSHTTSGHAWLPHEWLSETILYLAYRAGGYQGLWIWFWLSVSLIFIMIYWLCSMYSGNPKVAFLGGLAGWFFGTVSLANRPLILGHLFLVTELLVLEAARRRDRRWLWGLPPLFALWVNCHGSYALGLLVLAVFAVCSFLDFGAGRLMCTRAEPAERRLLGVTFFLCLAALCANPVGPRMLAYPIDVFMNQPEGLAMISEWQPLNPREARGIGLLVLAGIFVLIFLVRSTVLRLPELLLLAIGFGLALRHVRFAFLVGILVGPILCRLLADTGVSYNRVRQNRVVHALLIATCALIIVLGFPGVSQIEEQIARNNPVAAVEFVRRAGLRGPMLNDYQWGGYLIWAMREHPVFIDGRADVHEWSGVLGQFRRWAMLMEDPTLLLDRYGIRFCLLRKGTPIAFVVPYLPGWTTVYSDDRAVVLARNQPGTRP